MKIGNPEKIKYGGTLRNTDRLYRTVFIPIWQDYRWKVKTGQLDNCQNMAFYKNFLFSLEKKLILCYYLYNE